MVSRQCIVRISTGSGCYRYTGKRHGKPDATAFGRRKDILRLMQRQPPGYHWLNTYRAPKSPVTKCARFPV